MRVLSESAVQEIIGGARIRSERARQASLGAQNRLHVIKSEAREAAERLKKLRPRAYAPDDLGRPAEVCSSARHRVA